MLRLLIDEAHLVAINRERRGVGIKPEDRTDVRCAEVPAALGKPLSTLCHGLPPVALAMAVSSLVIASARPRG